MSEKTDNKVPNVPNLRFSSSILDWELKPITTLIEECSETTSNFEKYPLYSFTIEDGVVPKSERYERSFLVKKDGDSFKVVKYNNFVMNPMNLRFGAISYSKVKNDVSVSGYYNIFNIDNAQCNDYWEALFRRTKTLKLYDSVATGSLLEKKRVHFSQFRSLKFYIPEYNERIKISLFFSKINERIDTQSKIIGNLESLIKGIRQRIFSASNFDIRNSKEHELGSFLSEYSKKNIENNLISVSVGKYGIRRRDEIYSKELSDDYSKNKVIEKDSLIIGMGSTQIDIGILSKDEKYCVSPAYTTYKISGINSDYLREYLIHLNSLLSKRYMVIGARQGKSVNKSELMQHVLLVHNIEKQLKVVDIFNVFYDKLQKEKDILSLYKKQKAYLLANMFI